VSTSRESVSPDSLFALDSLLHEDEIAVRDTARRFVEHRIRPSIADWYSEGELTPEVTSELHVLVIGQTLTGISAFR